jgi:hypothetical protein
MLMTKSGWEFVFPVEVDWLIDGEVSSPIGVCMVGYFAKPNYIQTKTRYMDLDT